MAIKQASRLLNLKTPLGENTLVLTGFEGEEGLSQLFRFTLSMISDNAGIQGKDILGKNVTFSVQLADESPRHFNGFVSRFSAGDQDENGRRTYRAEVVPWLWFLTRNSDCRIFQKMTAPDIIQQIFNDRGFSDFTPKLSGSHAKREYCVQHQETDFNFVSRLMEEEGIFYFFEHKDGKHQMILGDKATAYIKCSQGEVDYPFDFGSMALEDHIRSWEHAYEFRTGKLAQTDYNFETPSTSLATNASTIVSLPGNTKYEFFEYPGLYINKGNGQPLTDVRMEEEEAGHDQVVGTSLCRSFTPGGKFKIRQHRASSEEGKSYVITSVRHAAVELLPYETGSVPGEGYENSFTCVPDSINYRPPRISPKPRVQGVQTAVVVGPSGEEIYPDKYGRVKVQFHWDRYGKKDENSSCWVRVSQVHAGKGFGGIDIPRIGDEVIVGFPNGDPDQPIIVGRLYHAENMPPFGLPGSKTISGLKSKTYKGEGYNELVMDDTPGKELVRVHGQYDMDSTVKHDVREHVGNNRSRDVKVNETISIGSNQNYSIGANQTGSVGENKTLTVGSNHTETIGSSMTINIATMLTETVGINYAETVGAAMELTVGAFMSQTIGAYYVLTVGASMTETIGSNKTTGIGGSRKEQVGGKVTEKVGGNVSQQYGAKHTEKVSSTYTLNAGSTITLDSKTKIVLKTGSSSITMTSGGEITVKGVKILIDGAAKIDEKSKQISSIATAKNLIKGAMVNSEASAINTIKGSLVKIN